MTDHYQPVPNDGDQIRHRVLAQMRDAGVSAQEIESLDDPVALSDLHRIAVGRGLSAADFLPN